MAVATTNQRLWPAPLPPAGPLTIVCAWPALDIPASKHLLDGTEIAAAGAAAEVP